MKAQPIFFGPLLYFRTLPALERLTSGQLGDIAQHAEEEFFPAGSLLLRRDQPREAFFVIVEGKVAVRGTTGREETLGPGQAAGFLHLLARSDQELEARALWDTVALRVDWDAHLDVCERSFPILEAHMAFLGQRCQEELDRIREGGGELPAQPPRAEEPDSDGSGADSGSALNLVQRLKALHRSGAFPSSNMDALAELTRHLVEVRLEPGQGVWAAEEIPTEFLLVVSGRLAREDPRGRWRQEFPPGEVVGRFEALAGLPRRSQVVAQIPTIALAVPVEPLMDILEDHFTMAVDFTAELARELMVLAEAHEAHSPRGELL